MNEKICIAIPINTSNLEEIRLRIYKILEYNPEFLELRFDYIPDVNVLTEDFIMQIKTSIESKVYSIFTFRDKSEGGEMALDKTSRFTILKRLIEHQPDFFDIEMNSSTELLSEIINLCYMKKVNIIFSQHNFESTTTLEQGKEIILRFEERVIKNNLNEFDILSKSVFKIIFTAQKIEDNLVPLTLCQEFSQNYRKIISFCMGEMGILSRLFCIKYGSFLTYASFGENTASGQINIDTLQKLYKFLFSE
jgi:3-dehydroquinate dehydratase type I